MNSQLIKALHVSEGKYEKMKCQPVSNFKIYVTQHIHSDLADANKGKLTLLHVITITIKMAIHFGISSECLAIILKVVQTLLSCKIRPAGT